ncbi:MAG: hypothetical protein MN733_27970 [Nitrososphaera sp.]|nr:hypothetical protein [Nitrososphaera sp.]
MKTRANDLIREYGSQGHPLGQAFDQEEALGLVEQLRKRLGASDQQLNLSSTSLKRLEQALIELHESLAEQGMELSDDELMQLVREVAAYFGLVLVRHAGGRWRSLRSLWGTEILIEGPIKVVKGRRTRLDSKMVYSLGNMAASAWDMISSGMEPRLFKHFRAAYNRVAKQDLRK